MTETIIREAQSFRIHLTIKQNDIGFERLYSELSKFESHAEQVRCIRLRLSQIISGTSSPIRQEVSFQGTESASDVKRTPSIKLIFRVSKRDYGFLNLYAELIKLKTVSQRNQLIRRYFFDGYSHNRGVASPLLQASLPASDVQTISNSLATPDAQPSQIEASPWSKVESENLVQEVSPQERAARIAMKRQATLMTIK